jgi:hypothetical protein
VTRPTKNKVSARPFSVVRIYSPKPRRSGAHLEYAEESNHLQGRDDEAYHAKDVWSERGYVTADDWDQRAETWYLHRVRTLAGGGDNERVKSQTRTRWSRYAQHASEETQCLSSLPNPDQPHASWLSTGNTRTPTSCSVNKV